MHPSFTDQSWLDKFGRGGTHEHRGPWAQRVEANDAAVAVHDAIRLQTMRADLAKVRADLCMSLTAGPEVSYEDWQRGMLKGVIALVNLQRRVDNAAKAVASGQPLAEEA